ncbi:hypothetical protein TEA_023260 [Camellia sinensis var. sinensis]|uniref:Uncharacterized protein n=1 Tax=Camellia sinensis var. sinensis TaxID=542762 RepID=A0A4S4DSD2_CAMSN|nr:hypothetical protein TEA_023260 [Camellia sinensis var. sinensis]
MKDGTEGGGCDNGGVPVALEAVEVDGSCWDGCTLSCVYKRLALKLDMARVQYGIRLIGECSVIKKGIEAAALCPLLNFFLEVGLKTMNWFKSLTCNDIKGHAVTKQSAKSVVGFIGTAFGPIFLIGDVFSSEICPVLHELILKFIYELRIKGHAVTKQSAKSVVGFIGTAFGPIFLIGDVFSSEICPVLHELILKFVYELRVLFGMQRRPLSQAYSNLAGYGHVQFACYLAAILLRSFFRHLTKNGLKNEIKQRESMWSAVYWELVEPVVKIRTLRARLASIGVDQNDLNKTFIQLTLEFLKVRTIGVDQNDLNKTFIQLTLEFLTKQVYCFSPTVCSSTCLQVVELLHYHIYLTAQLMNLTTMLGLGVSKFLACTEGLWGFAAIGYRFVPPWTVLVWV